MTYVKPEVVELVVAARAIRAGDSDTSSDKAAQKAETFQDSTSTGAAYQSDE